MIIHESSLTSYISITIVISIYCISTCIDISTKVSTTIYCRKILHRQILLRVGSFFFRYGRDSGVTKRPREFKLDSRESVYYGRRNTKACPVSSDAIVSVWLVFCGLGDTIVSAPTTLPRALTSRNYGDCLDFSALPAFSRALRANMEEEGEKETEK